MFLLLRVFVYCAVDEGTQKNPSESFDSFEP